MSARGMLICLLRMTGAALLCALVFVFCPFEWMAAIHRWIGLGELAYTPLLSYLTRTLSALYAFLGATTLFLSIEPDRYGPAIRFLGMLSTLGGVGVTVLDAVLHLPLFWTATEGPLTILLGVALVLLVQKMAAAPARETVAHAAYK
ncbi:MAG: hypothetical protein ACM3VT_10515 [Solirubrobacterales bacterium]